MSGQAASRAVQRRGPMRVRVIRVKRGFSSALTVIALFAYDVLVCTCAACITRPDQQHPQGRGLSALAARYDTCPRVKRR